MMKENNGLEVLKIHRLNGESNLKAFADVAFAGMFLVKGLKVVEGKNGLFVGMPGRVDKEGKWHNIAYPLTKEFKALLTDIVLSAYESE
ncbi:MAG: septation protein SpoVG family protein [Candidatus Omnitrophica bacterium]|nr:septation protein SpoVG family protein [Candidatus Omnitrophota bacterium]